MNKHISCIDYKNNDFYFLYLKTAVDEGETGYKWHEHSFYEIMLIDGGESEYVIENRRYVAKKGDVLLIKPGVPHYKKRTLKNPTATYCLGFLPEAIANAGLAEKIFSDGEFFSAEEDSPLLKMLEVMKKKLEKSKSNASYFIKSMAEATVMLLYDLDLSCETSPEINNSSVQKMLDFIKNNLCSINKVEDISKALFFSESYTRTLFKKEMNIGIMEYVRDKKVLLAHRKIRHGKKPMEIYAECGFSNYPSFYRAYVSYFGHTPREQKI